MINRKRFIWDVYFNEDILYCEQMVFLLNRDIFKKVHIDIQIPNEVDSLNDKFSPETKYIIQNRADIHSH